MDAVPDHTRRFLAATGPDPDTVQAAMADYAADQNFPIIGPVAGGVLRLLARLTDANCVFEFGSGFGYSASWFLRGGAGHVVCTEIDADEADQGREFATEGGWDDRVTFEVGDALEIVEEYDGPFDVVLVDHDKQRYAEAFETVRPKLAAGGVVVADNVTRGPIDFDSLVAYFDEDEAFPTDDVQTAGVADYVRTVRDDPDFETVILPVGSGLAVSYDVAE